jgi:S-methylmethionine-dependent homocysteine/selenocysteine methylase
MGTFLFGVICVVTTLVLLSGGSLVVADFFRGYHPEFVLIPAGVSLITTMFYASSAFIGHARRRQKADEPSRTSTSVREASDQPQTPRQQAMVGLIGTITAALMGLFGTLVTVFFPPIGRIPFATVNF